MDQHATVGISLTILTVEDEDALRVSLVDYFQDNGHTVFAATDSDEGLALFRAYNPDIVLTDLSMPNGSGLDLIPLIRQASPHTPVVVISGAGTVEDAAEAMTRGAWEYIPKPIRRMEDLERTVQDLVCRARSRRRGRS